VPDPGHSSAPPLGSSPGSNVRNPESGTPLTHPQHHAAPVGHTEMSIMQHMDPGRWGGNNFVYSHLVSMFHCSVIVNTNMH